LEVLERNLLLRRESQQKFRPYVSWSHRYESTNDGEVGAGTPIRPLRL